MSVDPVARACEAAGVAVTRLAVTGKTDLAGQARLRSLVAGERPDLLHVHLASPVEAMPALLAARAGGARHIVTTEHAPAWAPLRKAWSVPAKRLTGRLLDAVIAVCEADARWLESEYGVPAERLRIVRNGVVPFAELPPRAQARAALGLPADAFVAGAVGALEEKKGVLDLLAAARLVAPDIPALTLLFAGEGSLAATLSARTGAAGVPLALPGPREDVDAVLASLDVFVLPSWQEALPLALLEAMHAGCAIVASRVGGIPEAIRHEAEGLLVEPRRPDELAAALARLAADAALRERLGSQARARARAEFTAERMVGELEDLYAELLARAEARG